MLRYNLKAMLLPNRGATLPHYRMRERDMANAFCLLWRLLQENKVQVGDTFRMYEGMAYMLRCSRFLIQLEKECDMDFRNSIVKRQHGEEVERQKSEDKRAPAKSVILSTRKMPYLP